MKLSCIILTKNNERTIVSCLESVQWFDDIVIIDDYSNDSTLSLIRQHASRARVFQRKLKDNFADHRNFGLQQALGEWILFVDSDEIVTVKLHKEIKASVAKGELDGYYIRRWDFIFNRLLSHGDVGRVRLLRLARRNSGFWKRAVHELWDIKGCTGQLHEPLLHYPHTNIEDFVRKINWYSSLSAKVYAEEGRRSSVGYILFYPIGKFLVNYFFFLGFLDGFVGFLHTIVMSFHSFLTHAKLWLLQRHRHKK